MMEEVIKLPLNSYDQLYHILKADTFTFCLICFEDISIKHVENVKKHLNSTNHAESVKCLFKACNPRLIDDIEDERFKEIVSKIVLDFSVFLGKETSYVSKKDHHWFCFMCEQNVSESNLVDAEVKVKIIDHVLGNAHVKKVKEVCFLYRLNDRQDFLLLNKSLVHCSICKDATQCKEEDLLKAAAVHLELKHPNYAVSSGIQCEIRSFTNGGYKMTECFTDKDTSDESPNIKNTTSITLAAQAVDECFDNPCAKGEGSSGVRCEISSLVKNEEKEIATTCFTDRGILDDLTNKYDEQESEVANKENFDELGLNSVSLGEIKDISKSFDDNEDLQGINVCICLLCKQRVNPVSGQSFLIRLVKHFRTGHTKLYFKKSLKDLINNVTFYNDPEKIHLISRRSKFKGSIKKLTKKTSETRNHVMYVIPTKKGYVCGICLVSMSPCLDDDEVLLERFRNHFTSQSHHHCEKEKLQINKAFSFVHNVNDNNDKTVQQLAMEKELFKRTMKIGKGLQGNQFKRQIKGRKRKARLNQIKKNEGEQ